MLSWRWRGQVELCDLAVQSVHAMGFTMGIMHAELKYTSNTGAQLIEVAIFHRSGRTVSHVLQLACLLLSCDALCLMVFSSVSPVNPIIW